MDLNNKLLFLVMHKKKFATGSGKWSKVCCTAEFYCDHVLQFRLPISRQHAMSSSKPHFEIDEQKRTCKLFIERKVAHLHEIFREFGIPKGIVVPPYLKNEFSGSDLWNNVIFKHLGIVTYDPNDPYPYDPQEMDN